MTPERLDALRGIFGLWVMVNVICAFGAWRVLWP